jgi:hypothetical protein
VNPLDRFANHGRDYILFIEFIEDCLGSNPGQHELVFTRCVTAECATRVGDDVWPRSWSDEFTDYERWTNAGEPEGYVWVTNWSLADLGFQAIPDSNRSSTHSD